MGPPDSEFIDLAAKVLNEYIEEHGFEKWYEPNWLLAAMTGTTEQAKAKWFNDRYGAQ